jgi:dUTP pyrophosphatase
MYKNKKLITATIMVALLIVPSLVALWLIPYGVVRFISMLAFIAAIIFWSLKILNFVAYTVTSIEGELEVEVLVKNESNNSLPGYKTKGAAAMDLRYHSKDEKGINLNPGETKVIPTGLSVALPPGYDAQIRSRSGLAKENSFIVLNAPGTIDSDYRGEIGIILYNASKIPYNVMPGERVAQMSIHRKLTCVWAPTNHLPDTERGEGGFGHTGKN